MAKQRNPNGMGSYRKKKDGRIEWRQTIDGKERSASAKTMQELQEKVKKIIGTPITKNKCTVETWFEKWLSTYIKPLKKKATYEQYNFIYKIHIKPVIGFRKISNIKPFDIQNVIIKMNEKGMSTKTMKHAKTVMSGGFKKAFEDEKIIPTYPIVNIDIPKKQTKERKTLSITEVAKIQKAMKDSRWFWAVKLMLVTGIRRGELLALKWSDIDIPNKRIVIDESNSNTGLGDTKSAKVHYIPLSKKAIFYLDRQKEMLKSEFNPSLENENLKKIDLIFPNEKGQMIKPNSFYHIVSRYAASVGIKASPHCFRHTFVNIMRGSMSLKELQPILGHDELTITTDIYGDDIENSTDKSAKKIDEVFNEIDSEIEKIKEKKMGKVIEFKRVK